jgi:aminopeptidase N
MEKLLNYFTPNHYDIDLDINKSAKTLRGEVIIYGIASQKTIKLHAKSLHISAVEVDDEPADFSHSSDILSISLPETGATAVKVIYETTLTSSMHGAYLSTYEYNGQTETIVATQFEPHYAREAFPCVDEPAAKATFTLSIFAPNGDTVLSNMPEFSEKAGIHVFETTPKMSPYLVAFAIGKFNKLETKNKHGVKITSYASLAQDSQLLKFANETAAAVLDYYNDLFGTPYPLPKLDQLALPDFEAGAMENWGLITYRESALLVGDDTPKSAKHYVALVIAHEISHQWFGNLVTMNWWDDLWLNESFATMIEHLAVAHIYPDFKPWEHFYSGDVLAALRSDCISGVQSVKQDVHDPAEIATLFDGAIVYAKGARLMLMLMRLMGEDNFMKGLRDYFKKHAYENTTGRDLWAALAPYADFDVEAFMTAWITQAGYPVITNGEQRRFLLDGSTDDSKWPIPEVKADLSGHYIINLSDTELKKALKNLSSLPLEEKLRLLIDRSLLAKTPLVSSASLIPLLEHFKDETNEVIWEVVSTTIADLRLFFEPNTPDEANFKKYLTKLIFYLVKYLTFFAKEGESDNDTRLRPLILGLAAYVGDEDTIKTGVEIYNNAKSLTAIDSETRVNVLTIKVKYDEDNVLLSKLLNEYKATIDPELKADLRAALTISQNPETIKKLLALLHDFSTIRAQDTLYFFAYLMRNPAARSAAWSWLRQNWDWVETHFGEGKGADDFIHIAASALRTERELEEFQAFFEPKQNNPALSRAIKVGLAALSARVALISSDAPAVYKSLKQ